MKMKLWMVTVPLLLSACTVLEQTANAILGVPGAYETETTGPQAAKFDTVRCRVVGIQDGDTLTCLDKSNQMLTIRLDQIDAPERGQPFANKSHQFLSSLTYGQSVRIANKGPDKYGRIVGEVFTESGQNVNLGMVQAGAAWAYTEYVTNPDYIFAEHQAKQNNTGLWSEPDPIAPSEWRKGKRPAKSAEPSPIAKIKEPASGPFQCGTKRLCSQMRSCAEARFFLNKCGIRQLDRDGDGVPCESLC